MSARLRHLETVESLTAVGAFNAAHWSNLTPVTGVAQAVIAAGNPVTALLTLVYSVQQIAGGATAGGVTTCAPGATVNLFNVGPDTLTVTVAAGGAATLAVSAGGDTYNASLWLVWV